MKKAGRTGQKFPWLLTGIATTLLATGFVATFYLAFPDGVLQQRLAYELSARSGHPVHMAQAALRPPLNLAVKDLTFENLPDPIRTLTVSRATITPRWRALLTGTPGVDFEASALDGLFNGYWLRDGRLALDVRNLPLPPWLPPALGLQLSGTLEQLHLMARLTDPAKPPESSRLQLEGSDLVLSGMQKYGLRQDRIRLGKARIVTQSSNGRMTIDRMTLEGGDLEISVSGSVLLAFPIPHSRLDLTLSLRPTAGFDPAAADLLRALAQPGPDGTMRLHLTGAVGQPKLQ